MSNQAVLGTGYTFQTLFLDSLLQPMAVADPTITIFMFSQAGAKITLVAATDMTAVPGDTGRYRYTYTIPLALSPGDIIYGLMEATDPNVPGGRLVSEESVNILGASSSGGLIARFVQGG